MKYNKKGIIISALFIFILTIFILSNSLKGPTATNSDSGHIMAFIKPIIDKIIELDEETLHIIIRKLAHFTEFAWLGMACSSLCVFYRRANDKIILSNGAFYCLIVGVCDEYIQSFTNRTSCVSDVVLDFAGALFGIAIVIIVNIVFNKVKNSKNRIDN